MTTQVPYSTEAEWSVIAQMLHRPNAIPEVIGAQVQLEDFFNPDTRVIFEAAVESYYADEKVDPVTVAERLRSVLSRQWGIEEGQIAAKLYEQTSARSGRDSVLDHARVVRRRADERRLLTLMDQARHAIREGDMTPEEISDLLGTEATKIATGTAKRGEILTFRQVGEEYVRYLTRLRAARQQGIELAAYTGLKFVDNWTRGIAPTELMLVAGEPGVGKSALTWKMAEGFARKQILKPEDRRVGTFVLSLEMALIGSSGRLASSISRVPGERLREGDISDDELTSIIKNWKNLEQLPLYWNFASNFRMSQLRAVIVEAIRKFNVGLIIIDHFRMFDPDRRINNPNQEDEAKARFLKEDIAKELNVAVVCLAHTIKLKREMSDGRPQLSDLRGSGQVSAHADIAAFMYRPWMYATENEKSEGVVKPTDAELIFRKNRNSELGTEEFYFDPGTMTIRDQW